MDKTLALALDAIDAEAGQNPPSAGLRWIGMARGLMRGYHEYWKDQPLTAEAVEEEFVVEVRNLDEPDAPEHPVFNMAGKKDVIVKDELGRRWIMDHKSTSFKDVDSDSPCIAQLDIEGQASLYALSEHYMGRNVSGAIWDMVSKDGIKMVRLPKKAIAEIADEGTYHGFEVSKYTQQYALTKDARENVELYEYRVARRAIDDPRSYFYRETTTRPDEELVVCAKELWLTANEVQRAREQDRAVRNYTACMNYNRPCPYLGLCRGYDQPDSQNWTKRPGVHTELDTLDGDGRDTLSASRVKSFLTCQRKHHYRYELGIERVKEDLQDAIYFGNLIHAGLEVWWLTFIPQDERTEDE